MHYSEFDEATRTLLVDALDTAWLTFPDAQTWSDEHKVEATRLLMTQLIRAAECGERDQDELVRAALKGIASPPAVNLSTN